MLLGTPEHWRPVSTSGYIVPSHHRSAIILAARSSSQRRVVR
jgi:hypothetical protein